MTFKEHLAFYTLGDDLETIGAKKVAYSALLEGYESEFTLICAACTTEEEYLAKEYLIRALNELNITFPLEEEATLIAATYFFKQVVNKEIDPYETIINLMFPKYGSIGLNWNEWKNIELDDLYALVYGVDEGWITDPSKVINEKIVNVLTQWLVRRGIPSKP